MKVCGDFESATLTPHGKVVAQDTPPPPPPSSPYPAESRLGHQFALARSGAAITDSSAKARARTQVGDRRSCEGKPRQRQKNDALLSPFPDHLRLLTRNLEAEVEAGVVAPLGWEEGGIARPRE